ncbi:MAG: DUF4861 family protein [Bacteroidales bacterium]|nr:DUF4861 family protein [Bacteroidales bacterium]
MKHLLKFAALAACSLSGTLYAQKTDVSLFWRADSVQLKEIVSEEAVQYNFVGHHGPAIENPYMALRIYFNNSGAIDVYSKKKFQLELADCAWYPTEAEQAAGYGCDEYKVGSTVGLGGINLWDGNRVQQLVATQGRIARVNRGKKESTAEMLAKGVAYKNGMVDILIRVRMDNKHRYAIVEAECTSGQEVQFVTGVNFHPDKTMEYGEGYAAVWGVHPPDVSQAPIQIGGGIRYNADDMESVTETADMIRLVSKPATRLKTWVISAGEKEKDLNNAAAFIAYVKKMKVK